MANDCVSVTCVGINRENSRRFAVQVVGGMLGDRGGLVWFGASFRWAVSARQLRAASPRQGGRYLKPGTAKPRLSALRRSTLSRKRGLVQHANHTNPNPDRGQGPAKADDVLGPRASQLQLRRHRQPPAPHDSTTTRRPDDPRSASKSFELRIHGDIAPS